MVQPSTAVNDLPANVLAKILIGASDDLCRHLSLCARVCTDWCAMDTHARASPQRRAIAYLPVPQNLVLTTHTGATGFKQASCCAVFGWVRHRAELRERAGREWTTRYVEPCLARP
eukprot:COSAG02_NODE_18635_length_928_cov_1.069964_1_plen_116_part_00